MRRFAYISRARGDLTPNDIKDIVDKSIANNFLQAVSGVMIFDGKGFFQVIEGESLTIASLVQRIRRDTRHHAIEVVLDKPVEQVSYPSWGMKIVPGASRGGCVPQRDCARFCGNTGAVRS